MKNISLPIRFGLVTTACLIAYFLILGIFNLHTNPLFSIFNGVITGFGIYETINYTKLRDDEHFNYTIGFQNGLITGFIASILFTLFFVIYATEIDPKFISKLLTVFSSDYNVHIGLVAFVVAIMGVTTTIVMTLTCMQFLKKSNNITQKA
ncbi:DUF4199 domain-containing protein [Aurantibacter aestuarii]|uniref:DUF4199 domain-containing protein n=1 Tax=Aurantibacter aestuarii TaxID=1266046 RepID=A0A2T1NCB3_9FLAO|nr:DUF4199 domain-containing protein [Aurantibacter aestuarii]PSG90064.1 DUF4199 domain-containing protein [Aurantibacter aestuarii]